MFRAVPDAQNLASATWIDLVDPDDAEQAVVQAATHLRVPTRADIAEVETSSRLATEHGTLYLSTPMAFLGTDHISHAGPLGIVLSETTLLTLRFDDMPALETFATHLATVPAATAPEAFTILLEDIVDRLADVLEHVGTTLDTISQRVFRPETGATPARANTQLRATLREIGRAGSRLSNIRASLLGVQRIAAYARDTAPFLAPHAPRLQILKADTASLAEYDTQLSSKVQFLLDATLGFISIEQNNGIKVLTVVSVVGVPPTLIASIYGMNFKAMPELQWDYGYAYALTLIVASALLPLFWFKKRGWI